MKVGQNVILILNAGDGLAAAISAGLHPNPSSSFHTSKDSFELSLECYGVKDRKASGRIIHFIDSNDNYEVSIVLLQNYDPPILACALNEVLFKLYEDVSSTMPTLIVPFVVPQSKLKQDNKHPVVSEEASVYGIKSGPTTDVNQTLSSRLRKYPSTLKVHHEGLALSLHLINVMKLPAVVVIGQCSQSGPNRTSEEEHQVICEIGDHLASITSLNFLKEQMVPKPTRKSRDDEEAWRALYG